LKRFGYGEYLIKYKGIIFSLCQAVVEKNKVSPDGGRKFLMNYA
jgi:hypothetical protein